MAIIGETLVTPEDGFTRYEFIDRNDLTLNNEYFYSMTASILQDDSGLLAVGVSNGNEILAKIKNTHNFRLLVCLPSSTNANTLYTNNMIVEIDEVRYTYDLTSNQSTTIIDNCLVVNINNLSTDSHIVKIYADGNNNDTQMVNVQAIDIDTSGFIGFTRTMSSMFEGCNSLRKDIIIPNNADIVENMFKNCTSITHVHSNWDETYNDSGIITEGCYSGCTAITHIDDVALSLNEYTTGLDNIPSEWGGYGFAREYTGIYRVEILSPNYTFSFASDGLLDNKNISWGDGTVTKNEYSHTYARAGTYIIKGTVHSTPQTATDSMKLCLKEIIQYPVCGNLHYAFTDCTALVKANISGNKYYNDNQSRTNVFQNCTNLETVIALDTKLEENTSHSSAFQGCEKLREVIGIGDFIYNTQNIENLFNNCLTLSNLTIPEDSLSNCISTISSFYNCTSLTQDIIIPSSVTNCSEMFKNCTSMTHIHSNWNNQYNGSITSTNCYSGCIGITHIDGESVSEGLDQVPIAWGGYGFNKKVTSIIEVEIPSDNYTLNTITLFTVETPKIIWGDGTSSVITDTSDTTQRSHVYEKAGTYTIKGHFSFGNGLSSDIKKVLTKVFQICVKDNLSNAFASCSKLTYVNLSAVTKECDFIGTFKFCYALETVDGLEHLNPIGANQMFYGCSLLQSLDLSNWNISKVTDMDQMFYGCTSLQSLNLSNWNVSKVTNMAEMFSKCSSLQSLDLSDWNVTNVTRMEHMFSKCSSLQSLDLSDWNVTNVTRMEHMFDECSSLQSLNLSNWNTSKVTNMTYMFGNCTSLQSLDLSNWDVSNVAYMSYMFSNCSSLQSLDLSDWNVTKVTDVDYMFYNCTSLTEDIVIPSSVTKCANMFKNCTSMTHIHSNWNNQYNGDITSTDCYSGCTAITHIDNVELILNEYTTALDSIPTAWGGYELTREYAGIYKVRIPSNNYKFIFGSNNSWFRDGLTNWGDGKTDYKVLSHTYEKAGDYIIKTKININPGTGKEVSTSFKNCLTEVIQYPTKSSNILFKNCTNVTSINVSGCINGGTLSEAFRGCTNLTTIIGAKDIFNSKNTTTYCCFDKCTSLTTLDIRDIDVSNVTTMQYMFSNCSALTELNIGSWNTSKVTGMVGMFSGCTSLTSLDLSGFDVSSLGYIYNMFKNCQSMTSVNLSGWEVAPLVDMEGAFMHCWALKTLEVNHLNTKKVHSMLDTFAHTRALTTLDISNWDLSAVTTMHSMIYGSSVTTVNYPTMEAPVLTNAAAFATNCPNLTSVYVNMPNNIQEIDSMMRNSPNIEDFGVLNLDGLCNLTSVCAINKDDYPTNKAEIRFRFKGKLTYDYATKFRDVFVYNSTTPLYDKFSKQTLIDLIDCLTDYSGTETIGTLRLGSINLAKLTADEILVATNKNWTLS